VSGEFQIPLIPWRLLRKLIFRLRKYKQDAQWSGDVSFDAFLEDFRFVGADSVVIVVASLLLMSFSLSGGWSAPEHSSFRLERKARRKDQGEIVVVRRRNVGNSNCTSRMAIIPGGLGVNS
jgi:hypothetical protein